MREKCKLVVMLALAMTLCSLLSHAVAAEWGGIAADAEASGIERGRAETVVEKLSAAGLTPEQASALFERPLALAKRGVPIHLTLSKMEEGLLKRVPYTTLKIAVETRTSAIERAYEILAGEGYDSSTEEGRALLDSSALALESGMERRSLEAAAEAGRGKSYTQLKTSVEAGETLLLSGIEQETVDAFIADCLNRNLNRLEVLRVVRFAQQKRREGLSGESLRHALWMGGGAGASGGVQRN